MLDDDVRKECDALVLGSLIKGLNSLGLHPIPTTSDAVRSSVSVLFKELLCLDCFVVANRNSSGSSHTECKFTTQLTAEIEQIAMPSGVDDSHWKHMKEQTKK